MTKKKQQQEKQKERERRVAKKKLAEAEARRAKAKTSEETPAVVPVAERVKIMTGAVSQKKFVTPHQRSAAKQRRST